MSGLKPFLHCNSWINERFTIICSGELSVGRQEPASRSASRSTRRWTENEYEY